MRNPQVFLFDEPLSNLDAKLRVQMRVELKKLHQRLGTTAIYVTHDQVEAMTLGDRVVVMKDGLIQQVGEPLELYNAPATKFVAGFIGSPAMNFADVTVTERDGALRTRERRARHHGRRPQAAERLRAISAARSRSASAPKTCASRPAPTRRISPSTRFVEVVEQLGSEILLDLKVGRGAMVASVEPTVRVRLGDKLRIALDPARLHFFDVQTEAAI